MKRKAKVREVKLHPNVIAWRRWRESDEGRKCLEGCAQGIYLENRLWFAFTAGLGTRVPSSEGKGWEMSGEIGATVYYVEGLLNLLFAGGGG